MFTLSSVALFNQNYRTWLELWSIVKSLINILKSVKSPSVFVPASFAKPWVKVFVCILSCLGARCKSLCFQTKQLRTVRLSGLGLPTAQETWGDLDPDPSFPHSPTQRKDMSANPRACTHGQHPRQQLAENASGLNWGNCISGNGEKHTVDKKRLVCGHNLSFFFCAACEWILGGARILHLLLAPQLFLPLAQFQSLQVLQNIQCPSTAIFLHWDIVWFLVAVLKSSS